MLKASLAHFVKLLCHSQSLKTFLERPLTNRMDPGEEFGGLSWIHNVKAVNRRFAILQPVTSILDVATANAHLLVVLQKLGPDHVQRDFAILSYLALIDECEVGQQAERTSHMVEARTLKCFLGVYHVEVLWSHRE